MKAWLHEALLSALLVHVPTRERASQHLGLVVTTACLLLLERLPHLAKGTAANMAIAPLPSLTEPDSLCLASQDYPQPSALALPGHWSSFAQAHRSDPQMDTAQSWHCVNPQIDCTKL